MTDKQIICKCNDKECGQCSFEEQLKAKEQECEELKKKCNIYTCGICGNKEDCNKLYKTLTEIKEIAEKLKNFYEELGKCEDLTVVRLKQILQKISEVIE